MLSLKSFLRGESKEESLSVYQIFSLLQEEKISIEIALELLELRSKQVSLFEKIIKALFY